MQMHELVGREAAFQLYGEEVICQRRGAAHALKCGRGVQGNGGEVAADEPPPVGFTFLGAQQPKSGHALLDNGGRNRGVQV